MRNKIPFKNKREAIRILCISDAVKKQWRHLEALTHSQRKCVIDLQMHESPCVAQTRCPSQESFSLTTCTEGMFHTFSCGSN